MSIVTISASYAAGGSEIGPQVATRLGLPFLDRAIPVAVANQMGVSVADVEAVEQEAPSRFWSMMARMASVQGYVGTGMSLANTAGESELVQHTEALLRETANGAGGVILGRAAAIVLADCPSALHVRLDATPAARIEAAMHQHGITREEATKARRDNDAARAGYVKHFYGRDPADADLYHVVIDTCALGWSAAEELIIRAARARGIGVSAQPPDHPTTLAEGAAGAV